MTEREFSVAQFFEPDGEYEYVRRFVTFKEAIAAFVHYTNNVATNLGVVQRVIITDGGDCTNMEWVKGKGITYPPEAVGKVPRADWKERIAES
jgi:hypothetical protein